VIVAGADVSLTGLALAFIDTKSRRIRWSLHSSASIPRVPSPGGGRKGRSKDRGVTPVWLRARRIDTLAQQALLNMPRDLHAAAIEAPSYMSKSVSTHERSGVWWQIGIALEQRAHGNLVEISPRQRAQYATGDGGADKESVVAHSLAQYPQLDSRDDNVVDAVVLAAMVARHLGEPIEEFDPAPGNLEALRFVLWPDHLKGTP